MIVEEFTSEVWIEVYEFPKYMISTHGRLMKSITNNILKPGGITNSGYIQYHFWSDSYRKIRYAHRLVAEAFIDSNIEGLEVDHLDGDKQNNCVWNLDIVSSKVNSQRCYDKGFRAPPNMKKLQILETGEEFKSLSDCARYLNRAISSVSYAALNGTPTCGIHVAYMEEACFVN